MKICIRIHMECSYTVMNLRLHLHICLCVCVYVRMLLDVWSFLHNTDVEVSLCFRVSACVLDPFNWFTVIHYMYGGFFFVFRFHPHSDWRHQTPNVLQKDSGRLSQRRVPPQGFLQFAQVVPVSPQGRGSALPSQPKKSMHFCSAGHGWAYPFARPLSFRSALGMFSELIKTPPDGGTLGSPAKGRGFKIPS